MRNKQEQQLTAEGYTFSGIYSSRDKEDIKAQAAALRKQGIPAKLLTKTYEGRGGSTVGWSVYIKKEATPPAKASQDTIDFYWPEIKQARLAAEARAVIIKTAESVVDTMMQNDPHYHEVQKNRMVASLLAMHDAGQLELKKAV